MTEELSRRISDVSNNLRECKTEVGKELEKGNIRMDSLRLKVDDVSVKLEDLLKKIDLLIKVFETSKSFFTFSGWLGTIIIKTSLVMASLAALIYFVKTGTWSK